MRRLSPFVLVLAAAALAGCGDAEAAKAREAELEARIRADIDKTRKDADRMAQALQSARDEARGLRDEVGLLGQRVAALESRATSGAAEGTGAEAHGVGVAKPPATDRKALLEELNALREKVFTGKATDEEEQRFWELARTSGAVDELMKSLEGKVKESPDDIAARMQLANAYIEKLQTVPAGMEQGMWGNKASAQWKEVLKRDPEHWDAQFAVGYSWTWWPEQMNKTPDAIRELEKAREIQERGAASPRHAQVYFQLSRMYQRQGKADKAKEILRSGLARHPDDGELKKALDSLEN